MILLFCGPKAGFFSVCNLIFAFLSFRYVFLSSAILLAANHKQQQVLDM